MEVSKIKKILTIGVFLGLSGPAHSTQWLLTELNIFGDQVFSDDFEDGLRNSAPTSSLFDQLGNTTEGGGALQFDSADGGFLFQLPPFPDAFRDQIVLNQAVTDAVSGGTTIQAHFQPMISEVANGTSADGYGIFISKTIGGAFLNVFQDNLGNPSAVYLDETSTVLGIDTIDGGSVTGDIVLDLTIDQSTDLVTPRYSIDGGISFIEFGDWDYSGGGLKEIDYTPGFFGDFVALGVYGQTAVPIPAAFWLFGSALVLLCRRTLRKA